MEKPAATRSACTEKIEGGRETGKHKMSESSLCNGFIYLSEDKEKPLLKLANFFFFVAVLDLSCRPTK